ncbi:MAG TPA: ASCH/PUA domain-containing protein [Anaerohalosphaeraceae bacterium]|nr:ASCH/PUA domain-containing protein [Anaerohalosphaeraceae bacterium]
MTHVLKIWPKYFNDIESGAKTFEVRKNDRMFDVGDYLILRSFDPDKQAYTGEILVVHVDYVLFPGSDCIPDAIHQDYVVLGIQVMALPPSSMAVIHGLIKD